MLLPRARMFTTWPPARLVRARANLMVEGSSSPMEAFLVDIISKVQRQRGFAEVAER